MRVIIKDMIAPTIRRVTEDRDKIRQQHADHYKIQEMCEELNIEVKELSSTRTESFKA